MNNTIINFRYEVRIRTNDENGRPKVIRTSRLNGKKYATNFEELQFIN